MPFLRYDCDFTGEQMHCHNYRSNESFKDKAVLVVGAAFSGGLQARELSRLAVSAHASRGCNNGPAR